MVVQAEKEVQSLAVELTDRLVNRGRVPEKLRSVMERFLVRDLTKTLNRIANVTSTNAGVLLLAERMTTSSCGG